MTEYMQKCEKVMIGTVDRIDGFYDKLHLYRMKLCLTMASKLLAFDQKLFKKMIVMAAEIIELEEVGSDEEVSYMR